MGVVSERVKKGHNMGSGVPLGVNLGKNADSESAALDYEIGCNYFANHCDYLVINVSSPNTTNLRALQAKDELIKVIFCLLWLQFAGFFYPNSTLAPPDCFSHTPFSQRLL